MLTSSGVHLNEHPKVCGHEWIRTPMRREEVDSLLDIIIIIGIMGFPTVRWLFLLCTSLLLFTHNTYKHMLIYYNYI